MQKAVLKAETERAIKLQEANKYFAIAYVWHKNQTNYIEAIIHYLQAIKIFDEFNDVEMVREILTQLTEIINWAGCPTDNGNIESSIENYRDFRDYFIRILRQTPGEIISSIKSNKTYKQEHDKLIEILRTLGEKI